MCAIMGYTGTDLSREQLEGCFQLLKSRGPDDSRTLQVPGGTLLFHRLAIMGPDSTGMQPFTAPDGSAVVCNGELYWFRKVKRELEAKGYTFVSAEIEQVPDVYSAIEDPDMALKMEKLLDVLEDDDDVQNVWHNWDRPDEE